MTQQTYRRRLGHPDGRDGYHVNLTFLRPGSLTVSFSTYSRPTPEVVSMTMGSHPTVDRKVEWVKAFLVCAAVPVGVAEEAEKFIRSTLKKLRS